MTRIAPTPLARAAATAALLAGLSAAAQAATPVLVGYPAPGGNSASAIVGSSPASGSGLTWAYGGFDLSASADLFYGVGNWVGGSFVPGWPTLTFDGTPDVLLYDAAASALASGQAVFSGTSIVYTVGGPRIAFTRFTLAVTDGGGAPLALTPAASVGLPAELGGVLDVAGDYRATWRFDASFTQGAGYTIANSFFDTVPSKTPGYSVQSSVGGAFYAVPVPEPQTAVLWLSGLVALGWIGRRRRA